MITHGATFPLADFNTSNIVSLRYFGCVVTVHNFVRLRVMASSCGTRKNEYAAYSSSSSYAAYYGRNSYSTEIFALLPRPGVKSHFVYFRG